MVDLPTHYDTGTATITNASTTVTGQGTSWLSAITVGDILIGKFGEIGIVSAVGSNTSITLSRAWQGTSQTTDDYEIWFTPDATRMQETTRQVLEYLANGYLEAISGLTPTDGNIIVGNGSTWVAESGATARASLGAIGGSVGATDNRLTRSDGTGAATLQSTGITVDDSNNVSGLGTLAAGATTLSGVLLLDDSTNVTTAPVLAFDGDANTGFGHSAADTIEITTGGVVRVQVTSAGVVSLPIGQLAFPASQNASAGANTLDDVEEGTATPAYSATGATFSYSVQSLRYLKLAAWVSFRSMVALNTSGNTLTANILSQTGLPFTSANAGSDTMLGSAEWYQTTTSYVQVSALIVQNTTSIAPKGNTAASTQNITGVNSNALLHATNGTQFALSGGYEASA